jgi:cell division protein ZapA (FtsZ GTPase activity inhibitor)
MTAKKSASDRIDVEIFGSTYALRGGSDPDAVRALAAKLDAHMREIASPDADPLKVAILTALRLADETRETTEGAHLREAEISGRIAALSARIEDALRPAGDAAVPSRAEGPGAALDGARPVG